MRHVPITPILFAFILLIGCAPRMPVSAKSKVLDSKTIQQSGLYTTSPTQEISTINVPFKCKSSDKTLIVLDPGHGGEDYGTGSLGKPKYHEKYLNMATTLMVKNFLQKSGYRVAMTRYDDTFISLDNRAIFANEQNPILFVSIHYNAAANKDAEGIEVFYFRNEKDIHRSTKSKLLAQSVLEKVLKNTKAKSRGVKHGNYAVIRKTNMPAILIEGGFLTSEVEMDKIKETSYQKTLALGITQGIQDYLAKQSVLAEN